MPIKTFLKYIACILFGAAAVFAWSQSELRDTQNIKLQLTERIHTLEKELAELQTTPEYYIQRAAKTLEGGGYIEALKILSDIERRFPTDPIVEELPNIRKRYTNVYALSLDEAAISELILGQYRVAITIWRELERALPGTDYEQNARASIARTLLTQIERLVDSKQTNELETALHLIDELSKDFPNYKQTAKAKSLYPNITKKIVNIKEQNEKNRKHAQEEEIKRKERAQKERELANADLQLLNWSWGKSGSSKYVEAKGLVKNISNVSLKNVQAIVEWYDANDNFITSSSSLIEYNPILSNQKSPFNVLEKWNPAMRTARLRFKTIFGGSLNVYRDE